MIAESLQSQELCVLDTARCMLGEARNLEDIKSVRDKADAVRQYANSAHLGLRTQNYAAEIKLLAERRAGEMLSRMHLNGGYRRSASDSRGTGLKELGITANESARWQREASFSDAVFQRYLRETTRRGKELTSAGLLRAGARWESSLQPRKEGDALVSSLTASLRTMAGQQRTFGCIYALPPWAENRAKHYGAGTAFSKFAAALSRLPVKDVVSPQAHLHLWVLPEALPDCAARPQSLGVSLCLDAGVDKGRGRLREVLETRRRLAAPWRARPTPVERQ